MTSDFGVEGLYHFTSTGSKIRLENGISGLLQRNEDLKVYVVSIETVSSSLIILVESVSNYS